MHIENRLSPKWEVLELCFPVEINCDNPFWDVALALEFRTGNMHYTVEGFYDGEVEGLHRFLVRFAPMYEGEWEWCSTSNIPALDSLKGGFRCTEPVSRGPLTLNPQFPNWFFRADGQPQWIVNDGWYPHPLFGDTLPFEELEFPSPSEEELLLYLDKLGEYGVNLTLEVDQLYARQSRVTDDSFNWPWQPLGNGRIDRDRFNLAYYQRMDRVVEAAKRNNVFFGMELFFDNSVYRPREWGFHPTNVENGGWLEGNHQGTCWPDFADLDNPVHLRYLGRYIAYTVARFGAYWNVLWALGAESGNLSREHSARIARWYEYWGRFIACRDPHGTLQSIGDTGEMPGLVQSACNQFIITQEHTSMAEILPFCAATNRFGERFWQYGRPVLIGEQDRHNCGFFDAERKGYWVALASGFHMGRVDRHFRVAQGGKLYESILFCGDGEIPPIYPDLQRMTDFIRSSGLQYWRMEPADGLLLDASPAVYCLAECGCAYLVYFAQGGSASLMLGGHEFAWYNPRTGKLGDYASCIEGKATYKAPDDEDWALHIRSTKKHGRKSS